jgi:AcrR family transcriptional regulator
MSSELGLRERKKMQTRLRIAETAQRLFAERGFGSVTVAEVARAADVSEATVFNYFPTKEDLFYSGMETFEALLVEAVRARSAGETVLRAFQRFVVENTKRLAEDQAADLTATAARVLATSPGLQSREREIVARYADGLTVLIAEETGASQDDVEPRAVANALMGVQRALVANVRGRVLEGWRGPKLAAHARTQAQRAFRRLESGLGDYAVKRR